jgi:hypothetical protein
LCFLENCLNAITYGKLKNILFIASQKYEQSYMLHTILYGVKVGYIDEDMQKPGTYRNFKTKQTYHYLIPLDGSRFLNANNSLLKIYSVKIAHIS